jgi:hypothetical protein
MPTLVCLAAPCRHQVCTRCAPGVHQVCTRCAPGVHEGCAAAQHRSYTMFCCCFVAVSCCSSAARCCATSWPSCCWGCCCASWLLAAPAPCLACCADAPCLACCSDASSRLSTCCACCYSSGSAGRLGAVATAPWLDYYRHALTGDKLPSCRHHVILTIRATYHRQQQAVADAVQLLVALLHLGQGAGAVPEAAAGHQTWLMQDVKIASLTQATQLLCFINACQGKALTFCLQQLMDPPGRTKRRGTSAHVESSCMCKACSIRLNDGLL